MDGGREGRGSLEEGGKDNCEGRGSVCGGEKEGGQSIGEGRECVDEGGKRTVEKEKRRDEEHCIKEEGEKSL